MKLGVLASRSIEDVKNVIDCVNYVTEKYFDEDLSCVLSGSGSKVEKAMIKECNEGFVDHVLFEPYFILNKAIKHDKTDFSVRNKQIVDNSDVLVVFTDDKEGGLEAVITYAKKKGKFVDLQKV